MKETSVIHTLVEFLEEPDKGYIVVVPLHHVLEYENVQVGERIGVLWHNKKNVMSYFSSF